MADVNDELNFEIKLENNDAVKQQKISSIQNRNSPPKAEVSPPFSQEGLKNQQNTLGKSDYNLSEAAHPLVCIATFAFKVVSILMYFPIGYALPSVLMFIFVLVLSAVDFWVVKNISGRLLVGLRWRSENDEKGKQVWKFQSNRVDKAFFWGSQLLGTFIWGFFFIINILELHFFNCTLLFICTLLCFINLYGYYKCRGEHQKKLIDLKNKLGAKGLMAVAGKFM